ncbi:hypothetical protein CDD82_3247 [Ophiocordyceps australis]|uniref:KOW domain-containing protein n=1 Tax=Ophiocordyceps australis TaxID=1399860 RepID=A0A2C5ZDE2_9HYPO|nr:hypothetical protein CDD82_3247 [Ophiocordyceps australis]
MRALIMRRPMGSFGAMNQRAKSPGIRQQCFATATHTPDKAPPTFYTTRQRKKHDKVARFQLWPQLPAVAPAYKDPMPELQKQQIAQLDPTGARTRLFSRNEPDAAKVGDVLQVTSKLGEPFAGVMLQIRRRGVNTAIQLRGQLMRTSIEMWYKIYSPTVKSIEIVWRRPKRARRARLTYMRKPKHDMGSVEDLVRSWRRQKYAMMSGAKRQDSLKKASKQ